jgi:hypothetical protein
VSAFIVSKEHLDLLVRLAFGGPRPEPHSSRWKPPSWLIEHRTTPDELGKLLLAENVASVSYRYPNARADELPGARPPYWLVSEAGEGGYAYRRQPYVLTAVEGLKALACYAYQSCEHPEWNDSPAHAFCRSLEKVLIAALPRIDNTPWEWDSSRIETARTQSAVRLDTDVLDDIAALLHRRVWSPDTIADVASLVRASGRKVGEPTDDPAR